MSDKPLRPLSADAVKDAVELITPAFLLAAQKGVVKRDSMWIVVLDPRKRPWNSTFEEAILGEVGIGPLAENYKPIARAKARRDWETGYTGRFIQFLAPHLFGPGDTKWHGDANLFGLIVGASGVQGHFDEWVAWIVAHTIVALCADFFERSVMPSEESFIAEDVEM